MSHFKINSRRYYLISLAITAFIAFIAFTIVNIKGSADTVSVTPQPQLPVIPRSNK